MASTRIKNLLLNFAVLFSVVLAAFAFAEHRDGVFIVSRHFVLLKLALSVLLPLLTSLLCLWVTQNARPISYIMLLVGPAFVIFTIVNNGYYVRFSRNFLQFHYAYALLAFFSVYLAAAIAAGRKKITPAAFESFGKSFFAGYFFAFVFLFVRIYYSSRADVSLGTVNLIPFAGEIRNMINALPQIIAVVHTVGNVLFYSSFSLLLQGLFGSKIKSGAGEAALCLGVPVAASLLCEISQYLTLRGNADIDDFMMNSLGAVIGFFVIKRLKKLTTEG